MFKKIDADEALIVEGGVYKPADVYEGPEGALFVKAKGGFIRVKANGSTSAASARLERLHREGPLYQDKFGRLCVDAGMEGQGRRQVFIQEQGPGMTMLVEDMTGGKRRGD